MADVVEKRPAVGSTPRDKPIYGGRFAIVQLLVMLAFAGLLGASAYLLSRNTGEAWSSYKPQGHETFGRAQNMANYVAPRYVSNGVPIAVVQAQQFVFGQAQVDGIAFARVPAQGVGSPFAQFEPAGKAMLYVFCGPAAKCGLTGPAGDDVVTLLRRESLELALYTFKYWPDIDSVVVLLPPEPNGKPALLLRRRKLTDQLSKPLAETLPTRDVVTTSSMTDAERLTIQRLTESSLFGASFEQTPNGHTLLVLQRDTK